MNVLLLPRLDPLAVDRLLSEATDGIFPHDFLTLPPEARCAEVGGSPAPQHELVALRESVLRTARDCGFPAERTRDGAARFDTTLAVTLAGSALFGSAEALRDDVWAYIATALLGDVTHWRFGGTRARYHGGVRNCFQRLWMRAVTFDRGEEHPARWALLLALGEDAHVAIAERAAIGSDPVLAQAIASAWVLTADRIGERAMEPVMRRAVMRLRMLNETRCLGLLRPAALAAVVREEFVKASPPVIAAATERRVA